MEIISINETTWRFEDGFVRCFLLTGSEHALLIDSGASGTDVLAKAQKLTALPITLLNTHGDGDHTAGNRFFQEFYMHSDDYDNCGVAAKLPNIRCIPISDGDVFDLGNRILEVITIPGHTLGSVAILDRTNRLLFSGDSVQSGHIFMFGSHRAPKQFASSLEKLILRKQEFDTILPSHDEPELPTSYIYDVLSVWHSVCENTLPYTLDNLFGTPVKNFSSEKCGFFCNAD